MFLGFKVYGLPVGGWGLEFRVYGLGVRVYGLGRNLGVSSLNTKLRQLEAFLGFRV